MFCKQLNHNIVLSFLSNLNYNYDYIYIATFGKGLLKYTDYCCPVFITYLPKQKYQEVCDFVLKEQTVLFVLLCKCGYPYSVQESVDIQITYLNDKCLHVKTKLENPTGFLSVGKCRRITYPVLLTGTGINGRRKKNSIFLFFFFFFFLPNILHQQRK